MSLIFLTLHRRCIEFLFLYRISSSKIHSFLYNILFCRQRTLRKMLELSLFGQCIEILYSLIHSSPRPSSIPQKHHCWRMGFSKIVSSKNLFTKTHSTRWHINLILRFTEQHFFICLYLNASLQNRINLYWNIELSKCIWIYVHIHLFFTR